MSLSGAIADVARLILGIAAIAALAGVGTASAQSIRALTTAEKEAILQVHNDVRANVAAGLEPGAAGLLPSATDMNQLYWDEGLAQSAAGHVASCPNVHNTSGDREALLTAATAVGYTRFEYPDGFPWVGQNMYFTALGASAATGPAAVAAWSAESSVYTYGTGFSSSTGHFTQVAWADTRYVGCAIAEDCTNGWRTIVVCDYYPAGNFNTYVNPPWTAGTSCSSCDSDRTECVDGALCGGCPHPGSSTAPPDFCPLVFPLCAEGCDVFDDCLDGTTSLDVSCRTATGLCEGSTVECTGGDLCDPGSLVCETVTPVPTGSSDRSVLLLLVSLVLTGAWVGLRGPESTARDLGQGQVDEATFGPAQ